MEELKCKVCGDKIDSFDVKYRNSLCYTCNEKADKVELAESLKSNEETETSHEDAIICPWCGERWEDDLREWGDDGDYECDECGKQFYYEAEYSVDYSTSRFEYGTCSRCGKRDTALYSQQGSCSYKDVCRECKPIVESEVLREYMESIRKKTEEKKNESRN